VLLSLEGKFFVVELEYLAGFLLPVEEFFMLVSEDFSCSTWPSSSATQQQHSGSRLPLDLQQLADKSSGVPLFLLRRSLFFHTKSSPFACNSWISLWYLAKAASSFDYTAAACFRDFTSCSSSASARSTVSP
jgi:hypothetical protein